MNLACSPALPTSGDEEPSIMRHLGGQDGGLSVWRDAHELINISIAAQIST